MENYGLFGWTLIALASPIYRELWLRLHTRFNREVVDGTECSLV